MYTFGVEVPSLPEASSQMVRPLVDAREQVADRIPPGARHNGDYDASVDQEPRSTFVI
jgi:hypothetical protein